MVVRQGDPGDRFYVVAEGQLDVAVDGRAVRALGPGASFDEIALLRDVPRTATVSARTATRLLALDRAKFLATLSGSPASAAAADTVVREGLTRDEAPR